MRYIPTLLAIVFTVLFWSQGRAEWKAEYAQHSPEVQAWYSNQQINEEARARLMSALESAKDSCHKLEEKALAGARATDKIIREYPYQSIGIAFGIGLLIGVLVNRK